MDKIMSFELANNVFSGMLSLFAAVIGLAYPFILDVMERIQSRYVTEKAADWFLQENILRHFLTLMKINIPIAILTPYLLFLFDHNNYVSLTLVTIQSCFVCALLTYLMRLYRLVNIYGSYIEMANHTKREDMERLAIVMLSADNSGENDGYAQAKAKLYERMIEILVSKARKREGSIKEFPAEVIQIIGQILTAAEYEEKYPRTARDTTPISLLYDAIYNEVHPTKELRKFIWRHLNLLLRAVNTEWLKSYWEWATQYYRSMCFDSKYKKNEQGDFWEMHIFFAAMVFHCGNGELMRHIMTFRDATIENTCLSVNRFDRIIEMMLKYDELRRWPFGLVKSYQMFFITNDINADHNIYRVLCDYLALSLLCITKREETYTSTNDDYDISNSSSKEELEHNLQIVEWFRRNVLLEMYHMCKKHFTKEQYSSANHRLLQLIEAHNKRIKDITDNDNISKEKLKAMKNEIIAENTKAKLPFTKQKMVGDDVEIIKFETRVKVGASPGQLMEHQSINSVNFSEVLIACLRNQFYHRLSSIFLFNGSVKTYLIQYKDLCQAIKNIGFDKSKHILLNNGVSLWNYDLGDIKETDIVTIGNGKNNLLIVKRDDCPTYMYGEMDKDFGYKELDKENGLYWKEPTKENNLTVDVAQPIIIYNRNHTRYVKINVTYDRALGDCDLHKLKNIKEIL